MYLDKTIVANSGNAKMQHAEIVANRKRWEAQEKHHETLMGLRYNAAARLVHQRE
jgi:hypothetical protein